MTVVFQSAGTYLGGSYNLSPSFAVPSGVVADDIILVFMYTESTPQGNSVTVTPPAGFTEAPNSPVIAYNGGVSQGQYEHVFWKRATGADSGTYDFTLGANENWVEGIACRFGGCVTSVNPFDVTNSASDSSNSTATTPAVSVTTTGADRMLVFASTNWNSSTSTQPSGMTAISPGSRVFDVAYMAQSTAGSSGSLSATYSSTGILTSWLGALKPGVSASVLENATNDGTGYTSRTTGTLSIPANSVIVVYEFGPANFSGPWTSTPEFSITDSVDGSTGWTAFGGWNYSTNTSYSPAGQAFYKTFTSATSRTITLSSSRDTQLGYEVLAVTGADTSSPVVQTKSAVGDWQDAGNSHSQSITFDTAPTSGNGVIWLCGINNDASGAATTPSGFTALSSPPDMFSHIASAYKTDTTATTVSSTDLGEQVEAAITFGVEIKAAAGATTISGISSITGIASITL